jgi:C-terminal processing protease CtpA/Prc
VPESTINTLIGVGLSGLVRGEVGRIEEMRLGEFTFNEPIIAYPDSNAIKEVVSLGDRNGSIGGEVLRRFKSIFHYKDEYILLRENRDLGDNFHYNLSGIEINTPVPDIPLYVVSDVRSGSPADKEGVKMGDVIKFVNGESSANLDLNEIIEILQKNRSSRVRLGVERDTLFKSFSFRLDDLLKVDK